jgi:hypothetical protein
MIKKKTIISNIFQFFIYLFLMNNFNMVFKELKNNKGVKKKYYIKE